jgi:hypothetical protein
VLIDDDADRLGRVAGRRQELERDLAEAEPLPVVKRLDGKLDGRIGAIADDGAGAVGQFKVAAQEVGVEVGLDDPLDHQPLARRLVEVDADIAARIHHHRPAGRLVADEIRRVREAAQVVLGEDHAGWGTTRR